jgi:hypothetical protein
MNQPLSREIEIQPTRAALLFVDVQTYNCSRLATPIEYADASAEVRATYDG